jgi:hypothetical protein
MKRKEKELITTKYTDVSDEDIVNDFMEDAFTIYEWLVDDFTIDDYEYFWEDYELTAEDKERLFSKIQIKAKEEIEKVKKDEKNLLKDRESILTFISSSIEDSYSEQVGYALSAEEILDTILENGRK